MTRRRLRCWAEGAGAAAIIALLVAGVFGLGEMPAPEPDPYLPRVMHVPGSKARLWEGRARTCADLLSAETGAGYDLGQGDIETAAARATEWAEHVSELEDAYGD